LPFTEKSDKDLIDELNITSGMIQTSQTWALNKILIALELQRRRVEDLTKSSSRLVGLTKWLIRLTVVLAFLTVVLAIPEFKNLVAWLRAR
jgi:hypothetical protein